MKTITAIILSHYKEREQNLKRIVDDLCSSTIKPNDIIIFIDNPDINYVDNRCTIIKSSRSFLPIIRFAIGMVADSDYCLFIDDDMTVSKKTVENFMKYADDYGIIGIEGSILGRGDAPYTNDTPIRNVTKPVSVDVIIRMYFVATDLLINCFRAYLNHPDFPRKSLDDIYLCLGNGVYSLETPWVIPTDKDSAVTNLDEGGVGQSYSSYHYANRNEVCKKLLEEYI